jgi:hypothetical protein
MGPRGSRRLVDVPRRSLAGMLVRVEKSLERRRRCVDPRHDLLRPDDKKDDDGQITRCHGASRPSNTGLTVPVQRSTGRPPFLTDA